MKSLYLERLAPAAVFSKARAIEMAFSGWAEKQSALYLCNGIICHHIREWHPVICTNIDGTGGRTLSETQQVWRDGSHVFSRMCINLCQACRFHNGEWNKTAERQGKGKVKGVRKEIRRILKKRTTKRKRRKRRGRREATFAQKVASTVVHINIDNSW